jgi:DsbC/DsbD-like thiol-disulfide interchange protein
MAIRSYLAPALLLGVVLASTLHARAQEASAETPVEVAEEKPQVEVSTLFDVKAFVPGQLAHLVVVLDIPEAWHIYWANSGGAGVPTTVTVTGPEGWQVMESRSSGPVLHTDSKGKVAYVLKNKAAFFVPILPPDNAKVGQDIEFDLQVDWMLCKEDAHKGQFKTKVPSKVAQGLPVRNSHRTIAAMRSYLPRRGLGPSGIGISLSGNGKEGDLTFHSLDAREFDFFAYPDSPMRVVERNSESLGASRSMRNFHLEPAPGQEPGDIEVHGVLRVNAKGRVFYYEMKFKGVMNLAPVEVPAGHGVMPELPK